VLVLAARPRVRLSLDQGYESTRDSLHIGQGEGLGQLNSRIQEEDPGVAWRGGPNAKVYR